MTELNKQEVLQTLNKHELNHINGGSPSKDSGFWYDVAYAVVFHALFVPDHTNVPGAI